MISEDFITSTTVPDIKVALDLVNAMTTDSPVNPTETFYLTTPTKETEQQYIGESIFENTAAPDAVVSIDLAIGMTTDSNINPIETSFFTSSFTEVELETQPLEEIIRDIDNKVSDFTVPFDTPNANAEVLGQKELEIISENNIIGAPSNAPSDIWEAPSFVVTSNLIIPSSTLFPAFEVPEIVDHTEDGQGAKISINTVVQDTTNINLDPDSTEISGDFDIQQADIYLINDSSSKIFPPMTAETAHGHTAVKTEEPSTHLLTFSIDKITVTVPSFVDVLPGEGK